MYILDNLAPLDLESDDAPTHPEPPKYEFKDKADEVKQAEDFEGEFLEHLESDDELMHYGVKGMKWGVRKDRGANRVTVGERLKGARAKAKAEVKRLRTPQNQSADSKRATHLKAKKVHELSNRQIQDLTKRLELERKHAQLTARQPGVVEKWLKDAGNQKLVMSAAQTYIPKLILANQQRMMEKTS